MKRLVLKSSDINNREHDLTASARKVLPVDSSGTVIDSSNPFPVTGGLTVVNAIDQTAFDLNAAAFSEVTSLSNDYVFDSVELNFSTAESKTITITSADGTILLGGAVDTSSRNKLRNTTVKHFNLIFGQGFNANDNITVEVTQFSSAGTMDCILKVKEGSTGLTGNPVLGAGDEVVGRVKITDGNRVASVDSENRLGVDVPRTAFGDLRTAELHPQFQGSFEYTVDNTDLNTNTVVNGGTVTQSSAMAVAATSTTTASTALFESKQHAKYRPGLGGLSRFTSLFTLPIEATEQYIGLMDETGSSAAFKNGYAVGYDGTTFGFHRFQNDTKITVVQSVWDDPLDGTGSSGMTLDQTKMNVFEINFQYLGAGAIQLLIEDDSTGKFVVVHTILYANNNTEPSVHNPNFHHAMWVNNKATVNNLILKSSSYSYFVEGSTGFIELHQPENGSGTQEKTTVTTEVAIFTIRNKTTYVSKTNFIDIVLLGLGASIEANSANNLASVRLVKNAALGGTPSYSDINTTDSVIEIDTAGTTVTGGKTLEDEELAGKNDKGRISLLQNKIILNPGETLTVAGLSANSATIDAQLTWRELF